MKSTLQDYNLTCNPDHPDIYPWDPPWYGMHKPYSAGKSEDLRVCIDVKVLSVHGLALGSVPTTTFRD